MGIIDSLSAGFRLLSRRLDLLVLPLLLDLWLWLMPPLSIAPLLEGLAGFYQRATDVEGFPPELVQMSSQVSEAISMMSETSNLWTLLANTWLMHVPSMMATLGALPGASPVFVDGLLATGGLILILSLAGIFIGVIFLELVARALPIGNGERPQSWRRFAHKVFRHFGRIVVFVLIVGLGMLLAYVPLSFGIGVVMALSPALGSALFVLLAVLTMVALFFLYFVVAAIIMDDQSVFEAMAQSVRFVRATLWASVGFYVLTVWIIGPGFSFLLRPLAGYEPVGIAAAILVNSFLGTGLAVALFVFYRSNLLRMAEVANLPGLRT